MKIIIGLGNPESKYNNTYHNMGFNVLDALAQSLDLKFKKLECRGIIASKKDVMLVKPQTYMNLSGECVASVMKKYDVESNDIMVVYDDIDLAVGDIRIRKMGSGGTHNGMRSIISCIKTQDFPRLRVGIGRPREGQDLADYVLSNIPKSQYDDVSNAVNRSTEALKMFLEGQSIDIIMGMFN